MKDRFDKKEETRRDSYESFGIFASDHSSISYVELDFHIVNSLSLFAMRENFDFFAVERTADTIIKALPAIRRIFAKPIIHLRDSSEILPVEAVRIINDKTMTYASVHSELWENKSRGGIKPRKLLTINNQDDYTIYENVAFSKAIDLIMKFVRKSRRILQELIYSSKNLEFNLLDRNNHLNYYLAIGKLHAGYVRGFGDYYEVAERCLSKIDHIYDVVNARLESPVYKKCKGLTDKFTLKSTNILKMHRDYHRVYALLRYFLSLGQDDLTTDIAGTVDNNGYFAFCEILTLFAAGHFGFVCDADAKIDLSALCVTFKHKAVTLVVKDKVVHGERMLSLLFEGSKRYEIALLPCFLGVEGLQKNYDYDADEVIAVFPNDADGGVTLSVSDIDSFRRIQQIILRGLVYADGERQVCPFCSQKLSSRVDAVTGKVFFECRSCRTVIWQEVCPEAEKEYYLTDIRDFSKFKDSVRERQKLLSIKDPSEYSKYLESAMYFRNITPYNGSDLLCPYCGKTHK